MRLPAFVCLSVCLSVSKITQKRVHGFGYGSETWTMRKVDSDRIQSFHMQALRRILGIRWYDKVSNAVVNERTKLPVSYC